MEGSPKEKEKKNIQDVCLSSYNANSVSEPIRGLLLLLLEDEEKIACSYVSIIIVRHPDTTMNMRMTFISKLQHSILD